MSDGYVYVLTNKSLPGLIKIGKTKRDSKTRARELSKATGVPTSFIVAHEVFSETHEELESEIHQALEKYRESPKKEFFNCRILLQI